MKVQGELGRCWFSPSTLSTWGRYSVLGLLQVPLATELSHHLGMMVTLGTTSAIYIYYIWRIYIQNAKYILYSFTK